MIFDAQDFSRFEFCSKYPQLYRSVEPPKWPIHEAAKQQLEHGIRAVMAGEPVARTVEEFIKRAAVPGYSYPGESEPFILAQDHASWLEGALEIVKEESGKLCQLPLYMLGKHFLHIEAWVDIDGTIHLFRAASHLGDRRVRWPELAVVALAERECVIHVFRLPSSSQGRLLSPLAMAYKHPTIAVSYRLAPIFNEGFKKSWVKIARWEIQPSVEWGEWRQGIEKDKCIDQIREVYTLSPTLDAFERQKVIYDMEHLCEIMEQPNIWPRLREKCQDCVMKGLCHGDQNSRSGYQVLGKEEVERYEKLLEKPLDIV